VSWQAAVESIVTEHNRRADPRADAEHIGPAQRFALELLRDRTVLLPPGAADAEEAVTVERSSTVRHGLTVVRGAVVEGTISRDDAARQIVDVVASFGLQPVEAPPPLDPITEEDVGVVCWMIGLRRTEVAGPGALRTGSAVRVLNHSASRQFAPSGLKSCSRHTRRPGLRGQIRLSPCLLAGQDPARRVVR